MELFRALRTPVAHPDADASPSIALILELAADPDAPRSARDCGWVPGTGYCRCRPCGADCLFRRQCETEARRVIRLRRARRCEHRQFGHGTTRKNIAAMTTTAAGRGAGRP